MLKAMAILRSVVLVVLVGYLLKRLPLGALMSTAAGEVGFNVSLDMVKQVAGVAWLAIGWIALETAASWGRAWAAGRAARRAAATATAASSAAPAPTAGTPGAK